MKEYVCKECGKKCYSAAEIEDMINPFCPYCGGEIKHSEIKKQ